MYFLYDILIILQHILLPSSVFAAPVCSLGELETLCALFFVFLKVNSKNSFQKHSVAKLYGNFKPQTKSFKNGDYKVDMAQPLSNLIFYLLEPQSDDGLAYWNFFDVYIKNKTIKGKTIEFPVFKYFQDYGNILAFRKISLLGPGIGLF